MYTDNMTVQIVISLLKKIGVKHAVLSAGTRNVPVVHSLEQDNDFSCYSIVDERGAAYFALGLALETGEPVVMSCTSGTAAVNYSSAMWEATRQKLPLIALTSDRNQYYVDQYEDCMVTQDQMYRSASKKSVTLPIIESEKDAWYCERLVNEALLELDHNGGGPVHINIPTEWGLFAQNFNTEFLPDSRKISRYELRDLYQDKVREKVDKLCSKKRILFIFGQSRPVGISLQNKIEEFSKRYNCIIAVESISNLQCEFGINTNLICRSITKDMFLDFSPDLVISAEGDYVSVLKGMLKGCSNDFDHWVINEQGRVIDQFKKLTTIFECKTEDFLDYFNSFSHMNGNDGEYFGYWKGSIAALPSPSFPFSSVYLMERFLKLIPNDSIVHYGNGVAVHMAQYFPCDISLKNYCHTGTTTIDGSLSSFIGQAAASDKLCFAFIGDLSFFYDMNAIWNRHVGNNVRILLYNNEGGQTFHWNAAKDIETVHLHISAEHESSAKGWVESQGFKYYSACSKDEFDEILPGFLSADSDLPLVFEVFTKKEKDADILHQYYSECRNSLLKREGENA